LQAPVLPLLQSIHSHPKSQAYAKKASRSGPQLKEQWVNSVAVMDTGCEGGNFISSAFLADRLDMPSHIQDDLNEHHVQWVDIQGKTDFKPLGKVKLTWYGREIENGRKGKRSEEISSWFRVAPHLDSSSGEQPFQILFGQEFLHEHQLI
jgi:hypothetical protein